MNPQMLHELLSKASDLLKAELYSMDEENNFALQFESGRIFYFNCKADENLLFCSLCLDYFNAQDPKICIEALERNASERNLNAPNYSIIPKSEALLATAAWPLRELSLSSLLDRLDFFLECCRDFSAMGSLQDSKSSGQGHLPNALRV